jgi:hypothetical protein
MLAQDSEHKTLKQPLQKKTDLERTSTTMMNDVHSTKYNEIMQDKMYTTIQANLGSGH